MKIRLRLLSLLGFAFVCSPKAHAQKEYRFKNEFSTGAEAERQFGLPPRHFRNDPKIDVN
jgi:hypothetical protein